jgi:hypothetical protein
MKVRTERQGLMPKRAIGLSLTGLLLAGDGLLLRLTQDGVRVDDCDEKDVRLKPGSGDRAFQVAKVAEAQCRALEREKFGK